MYTISNDYSESEAKAYEEGYTAGELGLQKEANPYRQGTREYFAWIEGWEEGRP